MKRTLFEPEHEEFREIAREFVVRDVEPNLDRWDRERVVDRELWRRAGAQGMLGLATPEEYGGAGQDDFRYTVVLLEELARAGAAALISGFTVQDPIVATYIKNLGSEAQQERWLPGLADGSVIGALALTEPEAGSDLRGMRTALARDGDEIVVSGQKTFITNGTACDIVIVCGRGDIGAGPDRLSLVLVEADRAGFVKSPPLQKIGMHAQDTAQLYFDDVRVPAGNLLGEPGTAFQAMVEHLPLERLSIAVSGLATARVVFDHTVAFCADRTLFGQTLGSFQNTRFTLAEMSTELDVTQSFVDAAIRELNDGTLTPVDAAKAKWWATELQKRVVDGCLQLHGGYGFMEEYPVAKAFIDGRVQTIYGGTTEVMKEIIGRSIMAPYGEV